MSLQTLYLPKMGESVMEAVILHWLVKEGEPITEGHPLLEVATDKVDAEIPAVYSGVIKKRLVNKGDMVAIGTAIALIETVNDESNENVSSTALKPTIPPHALPTFSLPHARKVKITPLAKRIAQEHAIQINELEILTGLTKDKRVTKKILLAYLHKRFVAPTTSSTMPISSTMSVPFFQEMVTPLPGDEVVPMDRVRRLIADRMVYSKRVAPHVTSFIRADVTHIVAWRNQYKRAFQQKYGIKLSYNPIFIAALARTLQAFPLLNAVVSDYKIIKRKHINIGFAVALSNGNLLVPVLKKVETLDFLTLACQMDTLIRKARNGSLMPDALAGASYTISNIGSFDNLMGTPIIVQPQVAILALGAIERRPAVVVEAGQEILSIRDEIFLSHTYDHRIIDGAIGGGFLKTLRKELQYLPDIFST